ncbi:hypothetical protein Bbelb_168230 [Branchiostoma belcheri]|nr:hypothetical protein Bbelb_168230 [Branchiostoma belcheri]
MADVESLYYTVPHTSRVVPAARCSRRTNHALKLQTIASKNYYMLLFFPRTIQEWNELEPGVAEAGSLAQFKTGLASTLCHCFFPTSMSSSPADPEGAHPARAPPFDRAKKNLDDWPNTKSQKKHSTKNRKEAYGYDQFFPNTSRTVEVHGRGDGAPRTC